MGRGVALIHLQKDPITAQSGGQLRQISQKRAAQSVSLMIGMDRDGQKLHLWRDDLNHGKAAFAAQAMGMRIGQQLRELIRAPCPTMGEGCVMDIGHLFGGHGKMTTGASRDGAASAALR